MCVAGAPILLARSFPLGRMGRLPVKVHAIGNLRFKDEECILSVASHFFTIDQSVGQGKGLICKAIRAANFMGNIWATKYLAPG